MLDVPLLPPDMPMQLRSRLLLTAWSLCVLYHYQMACCGPRILYQVVSIHNCFVQSHLLPCMGTAGLLSSSLWCKNCICHVSAPTGTSCWVARGTAIDSACACVAGVLSRLYLVRCAVMHQQWVHRASHAVHTGNAGEREASLVRPPMIAMVLQPGRLEQQALLTGLSCNGAWVKQ